MRTVFLAGAIDNGSAVDWQAEVTGRLKWQGGVALYNPRRPDWDFDCKQEAANPVFSEQVEWELDKLAECDVAFFFFPTSAIAPISLMEFGIMSSLAPEKLIVVAEPGYWRRGNLEVVCNRVRVPLHSTVEDGVMALLEMINGEIDDFGF